MHKCDLCDSPAKYTATKRFNLFPITARLLCDEHRKKFEHTEDLLVILAIIVSVGLLLLSIFYDHRQQLAKEQQKLQQQQQLVVELDLDRDGRISLFEAQATEKQIQNYNEVGYPFYEILIPKEPTKTVLQTIRIDTFVNALEKADQNGITLLSFFPHPRLMKKFIEKYNSPNAESYLKGIFLTHDQHLAFAIGPRDDSSPAKICLDKLEPELYKRIQALH